MGDDPYPSIYGLADAKTGEVRYIGKANCPSSRMKSHMRDSRRRDTPVYRWIRKHGAPDMVILKRGCADWKSDEMFFIAEARARGDRLLNVAAGGDEPHCTTQVRAKNAVAVVKLRTSTPAKRRMYEGRRMLGQMLSRGQVSEPTKAKMRKAAVDYPHLFSEWANV